VLIVCATTKKNMSMILPNTNGNSMLLRWCLLLLSLIWAVSGQEGEPNNNELEKYLYHDDPSALPVFEYTDARKADFFSTDKHRVVKFYSPYCVSTLKELDISICIHNNTLSYDFARRSHC
jgi:hypothetical protein